MGVQYMQLKMCYRVGKYFMKHKHLLLFLAVEAFGLSACGTFGN